MMFEVQVHAQRAAQLKGKGLCLQRVLSLGQSVVVVVLLSLHACCRADAVSKIGGFVCMCAVLRGWHVRRPWCEACTIVATIQLVSSDLSHQETILQIVDALDHLDKITNQVFSKIQLSI